MKELLNRFVPKSVLWDARLLLSGVDRASLALTEEQITDLHPLFWNDLCSEYDAQHLSQFFRQSRISLTPEFKAFEKFWRRDEFNHYQGFLAIYSMLYMEPEGTVVGRLAQRGSDFTSINGFVEDEFKACVVMAYDEIATTRAYAMDYDLYLSFGDPRFFEWIKSVTRDEALHFHNCMRVIGLRHRERIPEIPGFVEELVKWDLDGNGYHGTFVLDHEGYYFTPEFLQKCGGLIVDYFHR